MLKTSSIDNALIQANRAAIAERIEAEAEREGNAVRRATVTRPGVKSKYQLNKPPSRQMLREIHETVGAA
jgi:hypothetical protein